MAWWQVQAEMPSGGRWLFGVEAADRESAQVQAQARTEGTGASGVRVTEIPPPSAAVTL